MKKNFWLLLGLMAATCAVAQTDTNAPAPSPITPPAAAPAQAMPPNAVTPPPVMDAPPASATNAPVKPKKKIVKKKKVVTVKRAPLAEPAVSLAPGPAEVEASSVNVRGQAGLKGEFITHLHHGDTVAVLGQINLDKPQVGEPAQWAKIAFPTNAHIWVNSQFIDAATKTVTPRKLNLRAGPGENFSVLGEIERGAAVSPVETKGDWTEIEPPATAYAFVAAMYLKQEASGSPGTNAPPSTETATNAPTIAMVTETNVLTETNLVVETNVVTITETNVVEQTNVVNTTNTVVTPAPEIAVAPAPAAGTVATNNPAETPSNPAAAATTTNTPTGESATNAPEAVASGPRIVTHEGVVRRVRSIIEPTEYELYDPKTDVEINYLKAPSKTLDLSRYRGMRIVVTGEETLAERWPNTPVLTVDRLEVVK